MATFLSLNPLEDEYLSLGFHNCMLQSVEGMKVVCHELNQATSDPEGSAMDQLVKDADKLVSCLANKAS